MPEVNIERTDFEKLCALQCRREEILSWFHTDGEHLAAFCQETYGKPLESVMQEYAALGKVNLRRLQFHLAEKNATMASFLGKVILGQRADAQIADDRELEEGRARAFALAELLNNPEEGRSLEDMTEDE